MKLEFNVDPELLLGAKRILPLLGAEMGCGITVTAVKGDRIGVSLKNSAATVYYRDKVQFFRGIGVLLENAKSSSDFEITEDGYFKNISAMIDSSRCGVPTVKTVKRIIDYMAIMGYTMVMLYTEDVIELEGSVCQQHIRRIDASHHLPSLAKRIELVLDEPSIEEVHHRIVNDIQRIRNIAQELADTG